MAAVLELTRKKLSLYPLVIGFYLTFFGLYFSISLMWVGIGLLFLSGLFVAITDRDFSWVSRNVLFWPLVSLASAMGLSVFFGGAYPLTGAFQRILLPFSLFIFSIFFEKAPKTGSTLLRTSVFLSFVVGIVSASQGIGFFHEAWLQINRYIYPLPHDPNLYLAVGFTRHHTTFAFTIIFLFHVVLAHLLFCKSSRLKRVCFLSLFFCLVAILFTFSRGAWLSLFISTAVVFLVWDRNKFVKLFLALSTVLAVLYFSIPAFRERVLSLNQEANQERFELWKVCWKMFKDSPFLGQGYDSFSFKFSLFSDLHLTSPNTPIDPHNMYLEFLATSGLLGLSSFLIFLISAFRFLLRKWKSTPSNNEEKPWFLGALGVLTAFSFGGFFDRYFDMPHTLIPVLILVGLCTSLSAKTAMAGP